jgi:uncharacterized membrane protein
MTDGEFRKQMSRDTEQMSNVNVGTIERLVSLIGGGLLAVFGVIRRGKLGALLTLLGGYLVKRGTTGHDTAYQKLGMNTAVKTNPEAVSVPHQQGVHVQKSVTVIRSPSELYDFWRNFENLPRFMDHLESVTVLTPNRSHWVAKAPAGMKVEWDAEIINDVPGEVIGWRSLANAQVANAGSVRFRPAFGGQGTEVTVTFEYVPPAGPLGVAVARIFGEAPEQQVEEELNRFKQLMESSVTQNTPGV